MKRWSVALASAMLLLLLQAAQCQEGFNELAEALRSQDDVEALRLSLKLEEQGELSHGLYYNRGIAYRNLNQLAQARASFEKALSYEPRDLATRRRLREVKDKLPPQVYETDVVGTPWWTSMEAAFLLLALSLLVVLAGVRRALGKGEGKRELLVPLALIAVWTILLLLNNPFPRRAIVVSSEAKLLEKAEGGAPGSALLDGLMVNVRSEKGHFLEIQLGDGKIGWVRSAEVVEL